MGAIYSDRLLKFWTTNGIMAPSPAEVKLVQLKNCFVNLPQSLVTALSNSDAVNLLRMYIR